MITEEFKKLHKLKAIEKASEGVLRLRNSTVYIMQDERANEKLKRKVGAETQAEDGMFWYAVMKWENPIIEFTDETFSLVAFIVKEQFRLSLGDFENFSDIVFKFLRDNENFRLAVIDNKAIIYNTEE